MNNQMGFQSGPVLTQQPTVMIMQSPDPTVISCPGCRATITTNVVQQPSKKTHVIALVLCLVGCWPCCLFPYFIASCKNANHTCPNCKSTVGFYKN